MSKYSEKAQKTIQKTMHEFSEGDLKSGRLGKRVTDRKQAIALGISKAHKNHQMAPLQKRRSLSI